MNKFTLNKNEDGRYELHQSDIRTWKRCRRKAQWSSRHGKSLQPKKDQTALWMGLGIHKALELYYEEELDPVWVWNKWCKFEKKWIEEHSRSFGSDDDEIEEQQELGEGMLDYYKEVDDGKEIQTEHNEFSVVNTEIEFEVAIPTHNGNTSQCDFVGRVDGICEDKYGRMWILEHKTYSNNDLEHLEMDQQATYYSWAMSKKFGEKFEGVLYDVLLKKVPQEPDVNKSGSISRRKKKTLTRELYEKKIEEEGLDKSEYSDTLKWIDKNSFEFVKRKAIRRNDQELKVAENQLYQEYKSMHNSTVYPNPMKIYGSQCGDCSFKDPCRLAQENRDPTTTLDRKFEERGVNDKESKFEEWLTNEL